MNRLIEIKFWKIRFENLLCVNVDFGSFAGGVLNDQEDFGDQFDDVTRLQHQVALPPAAERRWRPRRLLE